MSEIIIAHTPYLGDSVVPSIRVVEDDNVIMSIGLYGSHSIGGEHDVVHGPDNEVDGISVGLDSLLWGGKRLVCRLSLRQKRALAFIFGVDTSLIEEVAEFQEQLKEENLNYREVNKND